MGSTGRLHLSVSRIALVVLVACVAGAAATVAVLRGPRKDTAQTTVFVTRVLPTGNGGDINTSIGDFETALRLPQVDAAVTHDTGVAASTVRSGTSVSRLGASSAVRVSFTGTASDVAAVVVSATHHALTTLAQQQVDAATEAVGSAQAAAVSAQAAVNDLNQSLITNDIDTEYARHSENVINLQNQEAVTPSPGLAALIASEQARVAALGAAEPQYQRLKAAATSTQATLATAEQSLIDANSRLSAAADPTILTPALVSPASRVGQLARADAGAAVGAAVVLLVVYAIADASRVRRARRAEDGRVVGTVHEGNGAGTGMAVPSVPWTSDGALQAGTE